MYKNKHKYDKYKKKYKNYISEGGVVLNTPEEKVNCNICLQEFNNHNRKPVSLHRGTIPISKNTLNTSNDHFICYECYKDHYKDGDMSCPDCRRQLNNLDIIIFDYDEDKNC